jgi:hypothetical protein
MVGKDSVVLLALMKRLLLIFDTEASNLARVNEDGRRKVCFTFKGSPRGWPFDLYISGVLLWVQASGKKEPGIGKHLPCELTGCSMVWLEVERAIEESTTRRTTKKLGKLGIRRPREGAVANAHQRKAVNSGFR